MLATTPTQKRNLSGLSPQFAAIARQLPPKFIILLPSLNAMLAVLWCAITSAFLLVVSAWRWHMIKTYDVHMDPLERTSQIITLTEVINDILVSNSPSRDERLKALLAILDLAVRDVHFLLEGGEMPGKRGQPMNNSINTPRLTSALQLIEQAAAVLAAVSLSAEEMDAADVVDAIKACSSLVNDARAELVILGGEK